MVARRPVPGGPGADQAWPTMAGADRASQHYVFLARWRARRVLLWSERAQPRDHHEVPRRGPL